MNPPLLWPAYIHPFPDCMRMFPLTGLLTDTDIDCYWGVSMDHVKVNVFLKIKNLNKHGLLGESLHELDY